MDRAPTADEAAGTALPASWAHRPSAFAAHAAIGDAEGSAVAGGRRELARALEHAASGSDLQALDFAIQQATRGGVNSTLISSALKRKRDLDKQVSSRARRGERQDLVEALVSATGSKNLDMLEVAIQQAKRAGITGKVIESARECREQLASQVRRNSASRQAKTAMQEARQNMDIPGLLGAIKRSREADVELETIRGEALGVLTAGADQRHGMAAVILKFAVQGSSLDVLELAIEWARIEAVGDDELVAACQRRAELERTVEEEAARSSAAAALAAAWTGSSRQALEEALIQARRAGLSSEMLRLAERRLRLMPIEPAPRARSSAAPPCKPASIDIEAPMTPPPPTEDPSRKLLRQARHSQTHPARLAGVLAAPAAPAEAEVLWAQSSPSPEVTKQHEAAAPPAPKIDLEGAEERQQLCKEAATALKAATVKAKAEGLALAIEQAEKAGLSRELVAPARRKLARLRKTGASK